MRKGEEGGEERRENQAAGRVGSRQEELRSQEAQNQAGTPKKNESAAGRPIGTFLRMPDAARTVPAKWWERSGVADGAAGATAAAGDWHYQPFETPKRRIQK